MAATQPVWAHRKVTTKANAKTENPTTTTNIMSHAITRISLKKEGGGGASRKRGKKQSKPDTKTGKETRDKKPRKAFNNSTVLEKQEKRKTAPCSNRSLSHPVPLYYKYSYYKA